MRDDVSRWDEIRDRFKRLDYKGTHPPGVIVSNWQPRPGLTPSLLPLVDESFRTVVIEAGRAIVETRAREVYADDLELPEPPEPTPDGMDAYARHVWKENARKQQDEDCVDRWLAILLNRAREYDPFSSGTTDDQEIHVFRVRDAVNESIKACDWIINELEKLPEQQGKSASGSRTATDVSVTRRRGRPRDPAVQDRNKKLRKLWKEHHGNTPATMATLRDFAANHDIDLSDDTANNLAKAWKKPGAKSAK